MDRMRQDATDMALRENLKKALHMLQTIQHGFVFIILLLFTEVINFPDLKNTIKFTLKYKCNYLHNDQWPTNVIIYTMTSDQQM